MYTCTHTHTHTMFMCIYTHAHVHMHTHTHTHTHTSTSVYTRDDTLPTGHSMVLPKTMNQPACVARYIRLQPTPKDLVNNAATVARVEYCGGKPPRVAMEDIQSGYEELVSILLLIARQMSGMGPHQVEELEWNVGGGVTRVELIGGGERGGVGRLVPFCGSLNISHTCRHKCTCTHTHTHTHTPASTTHVHITCIWYSF